jgi:hypothetical protein
MNSEKRLIFSRRFSLILLILSLFNLLFWTTVQLIDVYKIAVAGAIFEILWFPMLLLLLVIPVVSLIIVFSTKKFFTSFAFYALIVTAFTIGVLIIHNFHSHIT